MIEVVFATFAVLALILLNGLWVAAEFAIVRVRRTRLEELSGQGVEAAKHAIVVVDGISDYLALTQLGITFASLAVGWLAEDAVARLLGLFSAHQQPTEGSPPCGRYCRRISRRYGAARHSGRASSEAACRQTRRAVRVSFRAASPHRALHSATVPADSRAYVDLGPAPPGTWGGHEPSTHRGRAQTDPCGVPQGRDCQRRRGGNHHPGLRVFRQASGRNHDSCRGCLLRLA